MQCVYINMFMLILSQVLVVCRTARQDFERILKTHHASLMGDPFIKLYMDDILRTMRTQVGRFMTQRWMRACELVQIILEEKLLSCSVIFFLAPSSLSDKFPTTSKTQYDNEKSMECGCTKSFRSS